MKAGSCAEAAAALVAKYETSRITMNLDEDSLVVSGDTATGREFTYFGSAEVDDRVKSRRIDGEWKIDWLPGGEEAR
jgi:hypothetical protein